MSRYNRTTTALGMAALIAASALLGLPYWREDFALADLSTGAGQWHHERLKDGSQLTLHANSSVALQFDDDHCLIRLLSGQVLVQASAAPLQVSTPQALLETHDARVVIERLDGSTRVSQLAGNSRIADRLTLEAGQQVQLTEHGIDPVRPLDATAMEQAWSPGAEKGRMSAPGATR
ncbi:FecR domain-containing protein [Pseudomonas sp. 148P]|uniref:FecR domain-containing protein n=1 Tax=Pseudomonas ulcerans TaxID=3115852 RepID=A0ABU7I118_9PSED|nr:MULTISPECIES: FecR domain-containing protein [unclassified Pseudomonas]MEE1923361.1 FecR domain-containing protein [Pseudomonas sp. 147P]MEE1937504.1 FecR domain-containing protein [Pseudomonas sp. 148P]